MQNIPSAGRLTPPSELLSVQVLNGSRDDTRTPLSAAGWAGWLELNHPNGSASIRSATGFASICRLKGERNERNDISELSRENTEVRASAHLQVTKVDPNAAERCMIMQHHQRSVAQRTDRAHGASDPVPAGIPSACNDSVAVSQLQSVA